MDNSISNLNAVSVLSINDTLPVVNGGETKKTTIQQIIDKALTNGVGNMLKSVYDTDDTGVVDNAESIQAIGRNATGSILYKGTIVYVLGSTGNRPNFVKARADIEATSAGTFGVIANDINNNSDGSCIIIGYIDTLDTRSNATNPFTTDTLVDGDTIYLSPTNAGYITNVKPSAPNHIVYLGKVTRTSPTNGTIIYRVQNGYELEELHNVTITTPQNGDTLQYDSSTSLWKNVKGIVKYLIRDYNTYVNTGTTAETIISNYLIPANTFNAQDTFIIQSALFSRTGTGTVTYKVYINTSISTSGALNVYTSNATTSVFNLFNLKRTFYVNGGLLKFVNTNAPQDNANATGTIGLVAYNPTQPIYLIFTTTLSVSSDTVTQEGFIITN